MYRIIVYRGSIRTETGLYGHVYSYSPIQSEGSYILESWPAVYSLGRVEITSPQPIGAIEPDPTFGFARRLDGSAWPAHSLVSLAESGFCGLTVRELADPIQAVA